MTDFAVQAMATMPKPPSRPSMPPVPQVTGGPAAAQAAAKAKAAAAASAGGNDKNLKDPATSIRFHLKFDWLGIGWWNSFDGLGMETAVLQVEEGGNNRYVHQLPTRLKYTNVKLSRPVNEESHLVASWFRDIAKFVTRGKNAVISAVDVDNKKVIASWELLDVVPVRWTGPSFNVESPKMATETLELAFHGFGDNTAKGA